MRFFQQRPAKSLEEFIEFYWYYDSFAPGHDIERVLPDGTFELVINLDGAPRKLFETAECQRFQTFRRAWLSGTHSRYLVINALPHSSMMGAHFRPGGAAPFLHTAASDLGNSVFELDAVWGLAALDLRDALLEQKTHLEKFAVLQNFLFQRLQPRFAPKPVVRHALKQFLQAPQATTIREVSDSLGISQRHFIAQFHRDVGLTPKRFCRIRRFHDVLRLVQTKGEIAWADVACDGGYYDQSHFINDFETFSGLNPTSYLRERGESVNHVPIRLPGR